MAVHVLTAGQYPDRRTREHRGRGPVPKHHLRHRCTSDTKVTYNDHFNRNKRDDDKLHTSAGCLEQDKLGQPREQMQGDVYLTSCRSCRSTDCTSAAYVILSFTDRVRAFTSSA